jgi:hypothetical protein
MPNAVTGKCAVDDDSILFIEIPPSFKRVLPYQPNREQYKHPKQLSDFITSAAPSAFVFDTISIFCKHRMSRGSDNVSMKDERQ